MNCFLLRPAMTQQKPFGGRDLPGPAGGAYSSNQTPQLDYRGRLSGMEGRRRKGRDKKGKGMEEREEMEGRYREKTGGGVERRPRQMFRGPH